MDKEDNKQRGILIVDDEPNLSSLLKTMLEGSGYQNIDTRINGREALNSLYGAQDGDSRIEVIVTDVRMPQCDALCMLNELAENGKLDDYGYVVVTGYASGEKLAGIRSLLGEDRYNLIEKPFQIPVLLETVEKAFSDYDRLNADTVPDA